MTDRVALITGGNKGLGLACAHRLAADGYHLAIVGTDTAALTTASGTLRATGTRVEPITADIRSRDACAAAVHTAVERFGHVDVLVNSAAIYPRRPVLDITADDWHNRQARLTSPGSCSSA